MAYWLRYRHEENIGFGLLEGQTIHIYDGEMFDDPISTGQSIKLQDVTMLSPCVPTKMIGLWNNFHERAEVEGLQRPEHPLYFLKSNNSFSATERAIKWPPNYEGVIAFEGELGIVIGKACSNISVAEAANYILGYTCVNDVTARGIMKRDPAFVQWCRAKGFDSFAPFGAGIMTEIEPDELTVRTLVNGEEKQNYNVSDMFFKPYDIVSCLSEDMTLMPGDVIACGTSVGAGPIEKGDVVEVVIDSVGSLKNYVE